MFNVRMVTVTCSIGWSRRKDRLIAVTSSTNDAELDVPCRDPPRLVFGEQLGCRAPAGLISEIDT